MIDDVLRPEALKAAGDFRAFYDRLLAIRVRISTTRDKPPEATPIREELAAAILGFGHVQALAPDALQIDSGYVLAAFADELLLTGCRDWSEAQGWATRPLEVALYGTALAGDRVFGAGGALADGRRDDIATATTILFALMMGMRGKWLDRDDFGAIEQLRRELYARVAGRPYAAPDAHPYEAFALQPTALTGPSQRPLPALWPWLAALAAVLLLYLPVSHLVWLSQVEDIDALAQNITRAAAEERNAAAEATGNATERPPAQPQPSVPSPTPVRPVSPPGVQGQPIPGPLDVRPARIDSRAAGRAR
ncbi:DotU family type IV/VI secretion system protein [Sphingomonas sp.]|uniref:DotU family type IV/VI secretion system protein n=1 Tax=Sphingomonas sp. TaxID=28214 RepID=UPI0028AA38E6|nr:DotU family type IV/VI secretion system protein [Sphingomonas sp.]